MNKSEEFVEAYLVLIHFLMMAKHRIVELGSEHGLTGMQTITLFLLTEPRPMNSFKKVFNCDASNVTGLVDGLEQKSLVSRYEHPNDRRIKMVQLEPAGAKLRTALLKHFCKREGPMLSRLSDEEYTTFISLLKKITSNPQV